MRIFGWVPTLTIVLVRWKNISRLQRISLMWLNSYFRFLKRRSNFFCQIRRLARSIYFETGAHDRQTCISFFAAGNADFPHGPEPCSVLSQCAPRSIFLFTMNATSCSFSSPLLSGHGGGAFISGLRSSEDENWAHSCGLRCVDEPLNLQVWQPWWR